MSEATKQSRRHDRTEAQPERRRAGGRRRYVFAAALAIVLVFVAVVAWAEPLGPALVCPACFGFERLSGRVFVERIMPPAERDALARDLAEAERRVALFYGALDEVPTVLACATAACGARLGMGARGRSLAAFGLALAPGGLDPVIIAHERSHIELHGRLGLLRFLAGAVPAWFDEGLAVVVSEDPRYLRPAGASDRCRAAPAGPLPSGMREWAHRAGAERGLYARAACRVLRWMDAAGGPAAVTALIRRVAAGERFEALYRDPAPHPP